MKINRNELIYTLVLSVSFILFINAFLALYQINFPEDVLETSAESAWVDVDLSSSLAIDTSTTTAFWNQTAGYVEAAVNELDLNRVVYAPEAQNGGTLMVSPDFDNDGIMISCSYYGCFKTSNSGSSWDLVVDDYGVLYVKESPDFANDGIVIALGWYGLYRSADFGETWTKIRDDIYSSSFGSIQFSPDFINDDTLYLTKAGDGLYQSLDTGLTWTKVAALPAAANDTLTIAISPDYINDDTLWVNARGVGVYKSTDRGASWATANTGIIDTDTGSLAVSPDYANDSTLFITGLADSNRIYKSTNGAASWTDIGAGISNDVGHILWKVFVSPDYANDQRLIVTDFTGRRSWYSDDAGGTWTESNLASAVGEKRAVNKMEIDASIVASSNYLVDKTLWMVSLNEKGFLKSTDGGVSWVWLNIDSQGYFTAGSPDVQYASDYIASNEIWVIDYYLGPMVTIDNGKSWDSRSNGLEKYSIMPAYDDIYMENIFFSSNYENDNTLFAFYASINNTDKFFYKSTDRGLNWTVITFPISLNPWLFSMDFSLDYANDNKILLGIGWEGLFESTDQGDTWVAVATFPADRINDIKFGANANEYIVAVYNNSLFYTDDDGANFTARTVGGAPIVKLRLDEDYATNGKFYTLSYENEFAEITDKGATVNIMNTEITDLNYHGGRDFFLSPDYSTNQEVYASGMESIYPDTGLWPVGVVNVSGQKGYFYKTEDAGVNWSQIDYDFIHSILEIEGHAMSPYFSQGEGQYLATKNEGLYYTNSYDTSTKIVQSKVVKTTDRIMSKVKVEATFQNASSGTINFYISTDDGNHWTPVVHNQLTSIDRPGTKLKWRAEIKANNKSFSPRIKTIRLFYEESVGSTNVIYSPAAVVNIPALVEKVESDDNLDFEVKGYTESSEYTIVDYDIGLGLFTEFPDKIRYTCNYDWDKFEIIPYLHDYEGHYFKGELKEDSKSIYVFPELSSEGIEIRVDEMDNYKYQFTVENIKEDAHYELWARQLYDGLVIREDFVFADTKIMYQQIKEKELLLNDLCLFLIEYKNDNYIIAYKDRSSLYLKDYIYQDVKDLSNELIKDNSISAIDSFGNIEVTVYSEKNYEGESFTFEGDVDNFINTNVGNNNISSLEIKYLDDNREIEITEIVPAYIQNNENSEILIDDLEIGEYKLLWEEGDWMKIVIEDQELWVKNKKF